MTTKPITNQSVTHSPLLLVYRLIGIQALLVIIASLVWGISRGLPGLVSTLLGGLVCIGPALLFAWGLMSRYHRASPQRILMVFYVGEFFKLFISAILMVLILKLLAVSLLPAVTGFIVASLSFWAAPFLLVKQRLQMAQVTKG